MNAIVAIITVIVAIILFTSIAYVKAPPNRAAIITGLLKEPRGMLFICPNFTHSIYR